MFGWDLTQTVLQYIMNINIECSYVQELQERLQNKHIEDMQAQMSAHKCTVESIKEQAEKAKLTDIQALRDQFTKEKGMWTMARTVYSSLKNYMFGGYIFTWVSILTPQDFSNH